MPFLTYLALADCRYAYIQVCRFFVEYLGILNDINAKQVHRQ